jgi:hypothetical protein
MHTLLHLLDSYTIAFCKNTVAIVMNNGAESRSSYRSECYHEQLKIDETSVRLVSVSALIASPLAIHQAIRRLRQIRHDK